MSKKNNLKKRRDQHTYNLKLEKEARELAQKKAEKKKERNMSVDGVQKKLKKKKGIRLRKNVVIRGIKIKDAASKKAALEILKAEQAMEEMEVEDGGTPSPGGAGGAGSSGAAAEAAGASPGSSGGKKKAASAAKRAGRKVAIGSRRKKKMEVE